MPDVSALLTSSSSQLPESLTLSTPGFPLVPLIGHSFLVTWEEIALSPLPGNQAWYKNQEGEEAGKANPLELFFPNDDAKCSQTSQSPPCHTGQDYHAIARGGVGGHWDATARCLTWGHTTWVGSWPKAYPAASPASQSWASWVLLGSTSQVIPVPDHSPLRESEGCLSLHCLSRLWKPI